MDFVKIASAAKEASLKVADLSTEIKNSALNKIADELEANSAKIFDANKADLQDAEILV